MKNLKLRFVLICIGTVLTLCLSYGVARASGGGCANIQAGGNAYGNFECKLIDFCGGWCYYECKCTNLFPGKTCKDVLEEAGFEVLDSVQCNN